jgi:hypothetical protein
VPARPHDERPNEGPGEDPTKGPDEVATDAGVPPEGGERRRDHALQAVNDEDEDGKVSPSSRERELLVSRLAEEARTGWGGN